MNLNSFTSLFTVATTGSHRGIAAVAPSSTTSSFYAPDVLLKLEDLTVTSSQFRKDIFESGNTVLSTSWDKLLAYCTEDDRWKKTKDFNEKPSERPDLPEQTRLANSCLRQGLRHNLTVINDAVPNDPRIASDFELKVYQLTLETMTNGVTETAVHAESGFINPVQRPSESLAKKLNEEGKIDTTYPFYKLENFMQNDLKICYRQSNCYEKYFEKRLHELEYPIEDLNQYTELNRASLIFSTLAKGMNRSSGNLSALDKMKEEINKKNGNIETKHTGFLSASFPDNMRRAWMKVAEKLKRDIKTVGNECVLNNDESQWVKLLEPVETSWGKVPEKLIGDSSETTDHRLRWYRDIKKWKVQRIKNVMNNNDNIGQKDLKTLKYQSKSKNSKDLGEPTETFSTTGDRSNSAENSPEQNSESDSDGSIYPHREVREVDDTDVAMQVETVFTQAKTDDLSIHISPDNNPVQQMLHVDNLDSFEVDISQLSQCTTGMQRTYVDEFLTNFKVLDETQPVSANNLSSQITLYDSIQEVDETLTVKAITGIIYNFGDSLKYMGKAETLMLQNNKRGFAEAVLHLKTAWRRMMEAGFIPALSAQHGDNTSNKNDERFTKRWNPSTWFAVFVQGSAQPSVQGETDTAGVDNPVYLLFDEFLNRGKNFDPKSKTSMMELAFASKMPEPILDLMETLGKSAIVNFRKKFIEDAIEEAERIESKELQPVESEVQEDLDTVMLTPSPSPEYMECDDDNSQPSKYQRSLSGSRVENSTAASSSNIATTMTLAQHSLQSQSFSNPIDSESSASKAKHLIHAFNALLNEFAGPTGTQSWSEFHGRRASMNVGSIHGVIQGPGFGMRDDFERVRRSRWIDQPEGMGEFVKVGVKDIIKQSKEYYEIRLDYDGRNHMKAGDQFAIQPVNTKKDIRKIVDKLENIQSDVDIIDYLQKMFEVESELLKSEVRDKSLISDDMKKHLQDWRNFLWLEVGIKSGLNKNQNIGHHLEIVGKLDFKNSILKWSDLKMVDEYLKTVTTKTTFNTFNVEDIKTLALKFNPHTYRLFSYGGDVKDKRDGSMLSIIRISAVKGTCGAVAAGIDVEALSRNTRTDAESDNSETGMVQGLIHNMSMLNLSNSYSSGSMSDQNSVRRNGNTGFLASRHDGSIPKRTSPMSMSFLQTEFHFNKSKSKKSTALSSDSESDDERSLYIRPVSNRDSWSAERGVRCVVDGSNQEEVYKNNPEDIVLAFANGSGVSPLLAELSKSTRIGPDFACNTTDKNLSVNKKITFAIVYHRDCSREGITELKKQVKILVLRDSTLEIASDVTTTANSKPKRVAKLRFFVDGNEIITGGLPLRLTPEQERNPAAIMDIIYAVKKGNPVISDVIDRINTNYIWNNNGDILQRYSARPESLLVRSHAFGSTVAMNLQIDFLKKFFPSFANNKDKIRGMQKDKRLTTQVHHNGGACSSTSGPGSSELVNYTKRDVMMHNYPNDLFITIGKNVYNLTDFQFDHDGGSVNCFYHCAGMPDCGAIMRKFHGARGRDKVMDGNISELSLSSDTTRDLDPRIRGMLPMFQVGVIVDDSEGEFNRNLKALDRFDLIIKPNLQTIGTTVDNLDKIMLAITEIENRLRLHFEDQMGDRIEYKQEIGQNGDITFRQVRGLAVKAIFANGEMPRQITASEENFNSIIDGVIELSKMVPGSVSTSNDLNDSKQNMKETNQNINDIIVALDRLYSISSNNEMAALDQVHKTFSQELALVYIKKIYYNQLTILRNMKQTAYDFSKALVGRVNNYAINNTSQGKTTDPKYDTSFNDLSLNCTLKNYLDQMEEHLKELIQIAEKTRHEVIRKDSDPDLALERFMLESKNQESDPMTTSEEVGTMTMSTTATTSPDQSETTVPTSAGFSSPSVSMPSSPGMNFTGSNFVTSNFELNIPGVTGNYNSTSVNSILSLSQGPIRPLSDPQIGSLQMEELTLPKTRFQQFVDVGKSLFGAWKEDQKKIGERVRKVKVQCPHTGKKGTKCPLGYN